LENFAFNNQIISNLLADLKHDAGGSISMYLQTDLGGNLNNNQTANIDTSGATNFSYNHKTLTFSGFCNCFAK
jgi:hypothetical protein